MNLNAYANKLMSATLSLLLITGSAAPASAQNIERYYLKLGNVNKFLPSPNWILYNVEDLLFKMEDVFLRLHSQIYNIDGLLKLDEMPQGITAEFEDVIKSTKENVNLLYKHVSDLRDYGPAAFEHVVEEYNKELTPSPEFRRFLNGVKNGQTVQEAMINAIITDNKIQTYMRARYLFDLAEGHPAMLVDNNFMKKQFDKLSYNDLLRSLNRADSASAALKNNLKMLNNNLDIRVYDAILFSISDRVAVISGMKKEAKEALFSLRRQIAEIDAQLVFNPHNKQLLQKRAALRAQKTAEINKAAAAQGDIITARKALAKVYNEDTEIRMLVNGMESQRFLNKNLTRGLQRRDVLMSDTGKKIMYFSAGLSIVVIVAAAFLSTLDQGFVLDGDGITKIYANHINMQRSLTGVMTQTPSVTPVMFHNATDRVKKIIADLSYQTDAMASDAALASDLYADEILAMTEADILKTAQNIQYEFNAEAKTEQMLRSAEINVQMQDAMDKLKQTRTLFPTI